MYVPLDYSTGSKAEALFRRDAARLEQTQAELLKRYLDGARKSEFARRYGLERVRTVREYQDAVPITSYEAMADDIARMQAGAQGVRFDDPVDAFVQTGGTSARSKVHALRKLRMGELAGRLIDYSVEYGLRDHDHPDLAGGQVLMLVGGAPPGEVPFASAHGYRALYGSSAEWQRRLVADPAWLEVLHDAPTRFYVLARLALAADVRMVLGLAPALIVFARTLASSTESLLRDVRDGTITADLPPAARAVLPSPAPDPELAADLARRAEPSGVLTPRAVWPRLCFAQCMMSGSLSTNRRVVREAYGVPLREIGYSSTEALSLAFSVRDEDTNVLLGVHTAFCELVDEDEKVHLAHEVSVGCTYRLVLTTPHGLYRYDTHDLLEVTGRDLGGAPVVQFVGRARVSNLMGEKLSEVQVSEAAARAAARAGGSLRQFVFIPRTSVDAGPPHYELRVEASRDAFDAGALAEALEAELIACNVLYETRRAEGTLGPVRVTPTEPQWFDAQRAHMETLSQSAKVPVFLSEDKLARESPLGR